MSETDLVNEIRVALSEIGVTVFRNNQGFATYKKAVVKYGVANPGGSDLIGINQNGIFIAIEVKTDKGRVTKDQQNFIDFILRMGGMAGVARSVKEALEICR